MTQILEMSAGDREELERLAKSGVEPHRRVMAAKGLLALAGGASVRATARALGSHQDTVRRWRDRFIESGTAGVGVVRCRPCRCCGGCGCAPRGGRALRPRPHCRCRPVGAVDLVAAQWGDSGGPVGDSLRCLLGLGGIRRASG